MERSFPGFPHESLQFLRQLSRNNNREWFQAHKTVFEEKVKAPMTAMVLALGGATRAFAPELIVEPRRAIYRIYRDTRFSSDKTPYKTHIAALFAPRGVPKHSGAALYFHISPEEVLIAGGVYMPGSEELKLIRRHIAARPDELRTIINDRQFKKTFGKLEGDQLTRAPREFAPDHPAIDLLRYKQYLAYVSDAPELAESHRLFPRVVSVFEAVMPLVRFINEPLLANLAEPRAPARL